MVHSTNKKAVPFFKAVVITSCACALMACTNSSQQNNSTAPLNGITAQSRNPSPGPALWRVQDQDTNIYIFGAVEIIPVNTSEQSDGFDKNMWKTDIISNTLDNADIIILETNEGPETQAALAQALPLIGFFRDGQTLTSILNEKEKQLAEEVVAGFGIPLSALNPLKPWLASIQLGALNAQKQGYQNGVQVMLEVNKIATEKGTPVRYLEETRVELLQLISQLPEATHKKMFLTTARQLRDTPQIGSLAAPAWMKGDIKALGELYHGEGPSGERQWADDIVYEALLVNRNKQWVETIKTMLEEETGTIFFTIGAGHVAGPDSLITMLEKEGLMPNRQ